MAAVSLEKISPGKTAGTTKMSRMTIPNTTETRCPLSRKPIRDPSDPKMKPNKEYTANRDTLYNNILTQRFLDWGTVIAKGPHMAIQCRLPVKPIKNAAEITVGAIKE